MNWPIKLQAPSCKHLELDRFLDQGYSRIKKNETRTYAQLNASRPRTVVTRRKYCSRNCSALETTAPGIIMYFFQDHKWKVRSGPKREATSVRSHAPVFRKRGYKLWKKSTEASRPTAKGSSFKPEATSSKIL